jgi:hypothetical protein
MLHFDSSRRIDVTAVTDNLTFDEGIGVHRWKLNLLLQAHGIEPGTACVIEGEVKLYGNPGRWLAGISPIRVTLRTVAYSHILSVALTDAQFLGIEELRGGGPLLLALSLSATIPQHPGPDLTAEGERHVRIEASAWQDATERLGKTVNVTITVPLTEADETQREAADHLLTAKQQLNSDIVGAMTSARMVMECSARMAGWTKRDRKKSEVVPDQTRRWDAIYKAALTQASGNQHADEQTRHYTRSEAEAMIGIAASMLKAASDPTVSSRAVAVDELDDDVSVADGKGAR